MKRSILAIALAIGMIDNAGAVAMVYGNGALPCAAAYADETAAYVSSQWVLGYITAASTASGLDLSRMASDAGTDRNAGMYTWVAGYCSAHPQEPLVDSVKQFLFYVLDRLESEPAPTLAGKQWR
jgi:hypothetical protein